MVTDPYYESILATRDLVGYWRLGEQGFNRQVMALTPNSYWLLGESSGNLADSSGAGLTATANGSPTYAQTQSIISDGGTAISFDGVDDYFTGGNNFGFSGTTSFSVGLWVYMTAYQVANTWLLTKDASDGSGRQGWGWLVRRTGASPNDGQIVFERWLNNVSANVDSGATKLPLNQWNFVVVSYDGTNLRLYLNGSLLATAASALSMAANANNFTIGRSVRVGGEYFQGLMQRVFAISGRAISQAEVTALYAARTQTDATVSAQAADASGNAQHATYASGVVLGATGAIADGTTAGSFGSNSLAVASVQDSTAMKPSVLSIEAWVTPSATQSNILPRILDKTGSDGGGTLGYLLLMTQTSPFEMRAELYTAAGVQRQALATGMLTAGVTSHVVYTYDGRYSKFYKNGALFSTTDHGSSANIVHPVATTSAYIGNNGSSVRGLTGTLDELSFYSRDLTAVEAAAHYRAGLITTGEKAYQYAIAGLCRSGGTRSDYYQPIGQVQIAGTLRSRMVDKKSCRITDLLNAQPNTATFECFDFVPVKGQEVIISLGTISNRLFAGHILNVEQRTPHKDQRVRFRCDCVDYTWLLDTRRITGKRYTNESVTNIVNDLMTSYAPSGFTTSNVEASLDAVDFTANHAETLMQALNRLMKMASKGSLKGGYCYVDYRKDLHAFVTPETDGNPRALGIANFNFWDLTYRVDLSQVRTRVYVMGGVTQTTSTVPNTASAIPVQDTRKFSATGGLALAFGNQLAYTATSPTSGPGWLTGVTSFGYSLPQGESVRVLATRVNSNAAASIAAFLGSGDGLIDHVIEDERLNDGGARDRGDGDLGQFEEPEEGVTFVSRDKFFKSGKTLPVSLTAPTTISTQLLVQSVEIFDIGIGSGTRFPTRRVDAATSYRDGFDILAAADQSSTEGPE